jgi:hypothetical protein
MDIATTCVGVLEELDVSRECRSNGHPVPAQDDVIVRSEIEICQQAQRREMGKRRRVGQIIEAREEEYLVTCESSGQAENGMSGKRLRACPVGAYGGIDSSRPADVWHPSPMTPTFTCRSLTLKASIQSFVSTLHTHINHNVFTSKRLQPRDVCSSQHPGPRAL